VSGLVHRILELPGRLVLLVAGLVVFTEDAILVGVVVPGETVALLAGPPPSSATSPRRRAHGLLLSTC
jgi:membrane protein DedA with SNARE-associated domain